MANKLYNEDSIRDIASAIREKNGTANTYNVAEMGQAIRSIQTESGGITPTGTIQINTNGTHDVTQYASASVNVPTGITPSGDITITENGSYDVTQFANAIVNVATGGGGGVSIGPWHTGTFQVPDVNGVGYQTNGVSITVTHNLGFAPTKIMIMADEYTDSETFKGKAAVLGSCQMAAITNTVRKQDGTITYSNTAYITNITDTTFDFGGAPAAYYLPCAWTYRWFAMA